MISGTKIVNQRLLRSIWLRKQYEMVSLCFCGGFLLSLIPFLSSLGLSSLSLEYIRNDFPTHSYPSSHTLPLSLRGLACCYHSTRGVGRGCQACQQVRRFLPCLDRWGLEKGIDGCLPLSECTFSWKIYLITWSSFLATVESRPARLHSACLLWGEKTINILKAADRQEVRLDGWKFRIFFFNSL